MDYAGGPAGLTRDTPAVCYVCGWTGPGKDILFHDCTPSPKALPAAPCPYCIDDDEE